MVRPTGKVQTVLGPVDPDSLGITSTHEHLVVDLGCYFQSPAEASERAWIDAPLTVDLRGGIVRRVRYNLDNMRLYDVDLVTISKWQMPGSHPPTLRGFCYWGAHPLPTHRDQIPTCRDSGLPQKDFEIVSKDDAVVSLSPDPLPLTPLPGTLLKARGRKRSDPRQMLNGIIFRLRSGCQWNRLPKELGDDSTIHRTFQRWVGTGVLHRMWGALVEGCEELDGVDWEWQAADGAMGKARFGGT